MKVKYTGTSNAMNRRTVYEVLDTHHLHRSGPSYKIRNDSGRLCWYAKNQFVEVTNNHVSSDLINKIERELKETEERMANLQKELENAKKPTTKNIFERSTHAHDDVWILGVERALDDFADALCDINELDLPRGLGFAISMMADGIVLDRDYDWKIVERAGKQILQILDR